MYTLRVKDLTPQPLSVSGKFFRSDQRRVFLKMVTYGPFPEPLPDHQLELKRVAATGFNAIRVYTQPSAQLLNAAKNHGLWVFVGIEWQSGLDFIQSPPLLTAAHITLKEGLEKWGHHPAVTGVFIANEIPADMVRWMNPVKVRQALENLIDKGKSICPHLLFAYSNFPTTEYLEPNNSDFTAVNVYLEQQSDFSSYLPRLHNIAGDRPVVISEFGLDTQSNTESQQKETLAWYIHECLTSGLAGSTIYAWSDRWLNGTRIMDDWSFGLTRRDGSAKPTLEYLSNTLPDIQTPEDGISLAHYPKFSVVVCTHNGGDFIYECLCALQKINYPDYEIIVVNDGSTDNTADVVQKFKDIRLINLQHAGLSAARNYGAKEATGDIIAYTDDDCAPDAGWLLWLAHAFEKNDWDACGGPNLPPRPITCSESSSLDRHHATDEAIVAAAPGAPSHVLLSDQEAEHIPGCNMVIKKSVLQAIDGFRAQYRAAGDDVDLCWRLTEGGYSIGFHAAAFVWHRRRATIWKYFKQQIGYGKAEALLMKDHPDKFRRGCGARWEGCIYLGSVMSVNSGSFIYHGAMGSAAYQQIQTHMQPLRPLIREYDTARAHRRLKLANTLQPWIRKWSRWKHSRSFLKTIKKVAPSEKSKISTKSEATEVSALKWWSEDRLQRESVLDLLLDQGWKAIENDSHWDLSSASAHCLIACEQHAKGTVILTRLRTPQKNRAQISTDFQQILKNSNLQLM